MRLRFLCSNHRSWLESDLAAAHNSWLRSYETAHSFIDTDSHSQALNYAGCALEAAELLLFAHELRSVKDIQRFTRSALLLCRTLLEAGQPRLVCGVVGGSIARLEELLVEGAEKRTVLEGCLQLLTVFDENERPASIPGNEVAVRTVATTPIWTLQ